MRGTAGEHNSYKIRQAMQMLDNNFVHCLRPGTGQREFGRNKTPNEYTFQFSLMPAGHTLLDPSPTPSTARFPLFPITLKNGSSASPRIAAAVLTNARRRTLAGRASRSKAVDAG